MKQEINLDETINKFNLFMHDNLAQDNLNIKQVKEDFNLLVFNNLTGDIETLQNINNIFKIAEDLLNKNVSKN